MGKLSQIISKAIKLSQNDASSIKIAFIIMIQISTPNV